MPVGERRGIEFFPAIGYIHSSLLFSSVPMKDLLKEIIQLREKAAVNWRLL